MLIQDYRELGRLRTKLFNIILKVKLLGLAIRQRQLNFFIALILLLLYILCRINCHHSFFYHSCLSKKEVSFHFSVSFSMGKVIFKGKASRAPLPTGVTKVTELADHATALTY